MQVQNSKGATIVTMKIHSLPIRQAGYVPSDLLVVTQATLRVRINGGNSLEVQLLGLRTFTAEDAGSIPGQETKIPQGTWRSQKFFFFFNSWSCALKICTLDCVHVILSRKVFF